MEIVIPDVRTHAERGDDWIELAKQAMKIQQHRKQLEELEKKLIGDLKELSQNVSSRGGNITFTASIRRGSVDYSIIPELRTVNLENYRKPSTESWKLDLELV